MLCLNFLSHAFTVNHLSNRSNVSFLFIDGCHPFLTEETKVRRGKMASRFPIVCVTMFHLFIYYFFYNLQPYPWLLTLSLEVDYWWLGKYFVRFPKLMPKTKGSGESGKCQRREIQLTFTQTTGGVGAI